MSQNITSAKHSIARIALAKSVISSFTLQRMLASKTVECGVLLANGDEGASCNVCVDLRRPSSTSLKLIQDINEEGSQCANLLGTLGEAREILMETNAGKKFNRVLIMHTDGETALSEGGAGLKELQRELLDDGVLFYLLVRVLFSFHIISCPNSVAHNNKRPSILVSSLHLNFVDIICAGVLRPIQGRSRLVSW